MDQVEQRVQEGFNWWKHKPFHLNSNLSNIFNLK